MIGIFIVAPIAGALIVATINMGPPSILMWMATGAGAWLVLRGPIGTALATKLTGGPATGQLDEETLVELDDLRARVAELEERQDFSERLLAQKSEPMKLEGPLA